MEGSKINHDCHEYALQCSDVCNYDVSSVFVDIETSGDPAFVVSDVTQRRVEKLYERKKISQVRNEERESWN